MLNAEVVFADLPPRVKGMLVKMFDDGEDYFTIVINSSLNAEQQREAYEHEVKHYKAKDFDRINNSVGEIEYLTHYDMERRSAND